jgi:hypothetical protein
MLSYNSKVNYNTCGYYRPNIIYCLCENLKVLYTYFHMLAFAQIFKIVCENQWLISNLKCSHCHHIFLHVFALL